MQQQAADIIDTPIFPLDAGRKTDYFDAIFLEELCLETMGNNRIKTRLVLRSEGYFAE